MLVLSNPAFARISVSLFCATLFLATFALTARAQSDGGLDSSGDPGTGGRNTIQGSVYLPSGRRLDKRTRVKLSSVRGGEAYTTTDDNGAFSFRRLPGGTYRVTIEAGAEYETASETVDIFDSATNIRRSQSGQVVAVQIQLQLKQNERSKPGVVNASVAAIPKAARDLYERALASAQAGDHKKAVEQLKSAVALHAEFPIALNELGVQYMKLGQPEKASEAFRSALKLEPDAFILHLNYGIVMVQKKEFARAEAELRRAIELSDTSAHAHLFRGRALIGLRRYDDAEKDLRTALTLGGEDEMSMAYRYLGALYIERGEDARAATELETYLRLAPKASEAEQIRGIITQLRGQEKKQK
jgi:Tfp pilus assembly protein PilF